MPPRRLAVNRINKFGSAPTLHYLCIGKRTNRYIMIQRIQSIYLLLAAALMATFLFLPIAQFNTPDGIYSFTSRGVSTVISETAPISTPESGAAIAQTEVFTPTWGVFVLGAVIIVLALITIFLYKNRPTQARICMINAFFIVTLYIIIFLSGYTFHEELAATQISWSAYTVTPFVALVLDILAYKAINKDEHLVRSLDRIR